MWLIARRSFTEGWMRLAATLLAAVFSIGLISGSLQFTLRAQEAVSGGDASEYARADVLVQGGSADADDPFAAPRPRSRVSDVKLVDPPPRRPVPEEPPEPVYLTVTGADQAAMPSVLRLGGRLPRLGDGEIALASAVMKGQKIKKGQRIVVRGARGRIPLTVAAAYHDPSHLFADQAVVSPATMDRLDPGAATRVVLVRGGSERDLARAFADAPGVEVLDRAGYVRTAAGALTKGMRVIYGFIGMALVLALFGMATTVSMSVAERTREFGLLGAVGATTAQIRSIVRWEAATVVLLGCLLGLGTALGTVFLMHAATGSSFLAPRPPWWLFPAVIAGAAAAILVTSALPARRAAAVPLLEAAKAG